VLLAAGAPVNFVVAGFGALQRDHFFGPVGVTVTPPRLFAGAPAVDADGDAGFTPLQLAARYGHADVVSLLLAAGASAADIGTAAGPNALDCALENRHHEVVSLLLASADASCTGGGGAGAGAGAAASATGDPVTFVEPEGC
jgi:hypothetical protein